METTCRLCGELIPQEEMTYSLKTDKGVVIAPVCEDCYECAI